MRDNISGVDVTVDVAVPSLFTRCPVCLSLVAPDEAPLSLTDVAVTSGPVGMTIRVTAEIRYTLNTFKDNLDK